MARDKMIVGENVTFSTDPAVTGLNNNVIVCAGTGAGKTMSVIEPRLLETYNSSLVVTVSKRRIVKDYTPLLRSRDYGIFDLNLADPASATVFFDPLKYIKTTRDIKMLAEAIVLADYKDSTHYDPYWSQSSVSLLSAEIALVLTRNIHAGIDDLMSFHQKIFVAESSSDIIQTSVDDDFLELPNGKFSEYALTCWRTFRSAPIRTASCIFSTLNAVLDNIFTPEIRQAARTKRTLDLRRIAERKTVVFVTVSPVNTALSRYVDLLYSTLFKELFEYSQESPDGKLPNPVSVLCDDFAAGGSIPDFAKYISIFRESDISVTLLLQSESQLASIYGKNDSTTIINNCDTYIYMGGNDIDTCRSVSIKMNVPLEDVMFMPVGEEIVFRRGSRPKMTTRYNIAADKRYIALNKELKKRKSRTNSAECRSS